MNEKTARQIVRECSGGLCEVRIESVCTGRASEWHHRRNRSQGGPWCPSNGLHLCAACHCWITANPVVASLEGWTVRSWEPWDAKPAKLYQGYCIPDADGGWTNFGHARPVEQHAEACAFWFSTSCDCGGGS